MNLVACSLSYDCTSYFDGVLKHSDAVSQFFFLTGIHQNIFFGSGINSHIRILSRGLESHIRENVQSLPPGIRNYDGLSGGKHAPFAFFDATC